MYRFVIRNARLGVISAFADGRTSEPLPAGAILPVGDNSFPVAVPRLPAIRPSARRAGWGGKVCSNPAPPEPGATSQAGALAVKARTVGISGFKDPARSDEPETALVCFELRPAVIVITVKFTGRLKGNPAFSKRRTGNSCQSAS